ncbi:MAG: hypothetical protein ACTHLD_15335 [Chitinophaga sp.]
MKKTFAYVLSFSLFSAAVSAQRVIPQKDTVKSGSWWTGQGPAPQLIPASLQYPERKKTIGPKQTVCFDKKFFILGEIQGHVINCCFVINSESGFAGAVPLYDAQCKCDFDILDPRFQFMLFTKKGVEFRYFNREERDHASRPAVIKHYVITGNTHRNQMDEVMDQKILHLKEGSFREFLNGHIKAREYVTDDGKASLFLAGDDYPKELTIRDHLGAYGLGHIKTDAGYYLVLGHTRGSEFTMAGREREKFGPGGLGFSTALFSVMEEENVPAAVDEVTLRERELEEKLSRQNMSSGPCASKKAEWTAYKLKAAQKEKEVLQTLQYQKIRASNEADMYSLSAMYNPMMSFAIERRELEHKLCVLDEDIAHGRVSQNQMVRVTQRRQCWENKVAEYTRLEDLWNEIETKYKNDPGKLTKARAEFQLNEMLPGIKRVQCKL